MTEELKNNTTAAPASEKKVLLSVSDLEVKFRVRSRILTAIRGISLDIYENESIAIVGESAAGKSVFTKTFAGMLENNGFISNGKIIFNDEELAYTEVKIRSLTRPFLSFLKKRLDKSARYENGAETYKKIVALKDEHKAKFALSDEEQAEYDEKREDLRFRIAETFNLKQTYDTKKQRAEIREASRKISEYKEQLKALEKEMKEKLRKRKALVGVDREYIASYNARMNELQATYRAQIAQPISEKASKRNEFFAKEIYLSVGRYGLVSRVKNSFKLLKALKQAMIRGVDLDDETTRNEVFDTVVFRVRYTGEDEKKLIGRCILNLANIKYPKDWTKIRGVKIATVFQDPMTSLNPIITIGKQITSVILKHQECSDAEARKRAIQLMKKVGIPNAENRFDDYPFQYSGGMRQRIVIAIALSCQPKILICDEPTTALDVTIQAQILKLIKDLQKDFGYTIVFITHDLGVVANVADRVAVLYGGQIAEVGTVEEIFYDPRHPYTWALLSSLPQLAERNTKLYSISGTPPSLYNKIVGDPFAPRNPYCLKIDTLKAPPMFKISETHYAKTWLLDPRAPKMEKPEIIRDIHGKLMEAFNI